MASKRELAVAKIQQAQESNRDRYLDLCLEISIGDDDPFLVVGGRWDHVEHRYTDDEPAECVRVQLHKGQRDSARWFADWLSKHLEYRRLVAAGVHAEHAVDEAYGDAYETSVILCGGRMSGKSWEACVLAAAFALALPGARLICVSPEQAKTKELISVMIKTLFARQWRVWKEAAQIIELVNGSVIEFHTGKKADMKLGDVDLWIANEAQEISEQIVLDLDGSAARRAGLGILTGNPPRRVSGKWFREWYEKSITGAIRSVRAFFLDPRNNPHVPSSRLEQEEEKYGPLKFRREILGDMLAPMQDVVFPEYSPSIHLLKYRPTDWIDVTPMVSAKWYGKRVSWILGNDFDKRAGCNWIAARFYLRDKRDEIDKAVMLIEYSEANILNEEMLAERMELAEDQWGYRLFDKADTIIVGDASASWQETTRKWAEKPPSFAQLEGEGWTIIKPDPNLGGNPKVSRRFDTANYLLRRSRAREPVVYVLHTATSVVNSLRDYPKKNGHEDRDSEHAHPADAWTYVAWRRWGRDPIEDPNKDRMLAHESVARPDRTARLGL